MANIELVIKISEEEYINIKNAINSLIEKGVERASMSKLCLAILDGTPLPKGHGKLIDVSELLTVTDIREDGSEVTYVLYDDIENADTIIEADREE